MMIEKYNAGKLDFEPTCPICTLETQSVWMLKYLDILELRANLEGIDLGYGDTEHLWRSQGDDWGGYEMKQSENMQYRLS